MIGRRYRAAMGKVLAAVIGFLALCILGLGLVAYLGREEESVAVDNLLAEDLTRLIQTAGDRDGEVDLTAAAEFDWDRVLLVAPGTPNERISDALGSAFDGELNYDAESEQLFVFARGSRLARYADYRGRASFAGFDRPIAELSREEAVLSVEDLVVRPK